MRPLSEERASACENATSPRCRCRCGGALHGRAHPPGFEKFDDGIVVQADLMEDSFASLLASWAEEEADRARRAAMD